MRMAFFFAALIACAPALAQTQTQSFSGTYTTKNPQGGTVTLTLKQDAKKAVTGTLTGNNNSFEVKAEATPDGLLGRVGAGAGNNPLWILAELQGGQLNVVLAEPGADGRPNLEAARRLTFAKSTAKPEAPQASTTPNTDQLSQFLTANAWCGFTYNQRSGTSTTERVVFHGNGLVEQRSGAQTYNSGPAGSVAGQHGGGKQGRWKVENGQLHLSEDGLNWAPQMMQVTRNSNGSPIIKSGAKEYMVCR
jgi:hypothetical protein